MNPSSSPKNVAPMLCSLAIVFLMASFVCFSHLDRHPFKPSDESLHVKATQHMLHTGQLLTPMVDGEPYFRKPPFKMWLSLIPVALLGESNFSYRFIDAAAGVVTALLTCFAGYWLLGSWFAGCVAGIALIGCRYFVLFHCARSAVQDSMLTLLSTVALLIGYRLCERLSDRDKQRATQEGEGVSAGELIRLASLGGLAVGLAVLTKSIAGLLPLIVVGIFAVLNRQLKPLFLPVGVNGLTRPVLIVGMLSILPAAIYFGGHAIFNPQAFNVFYNQEVVDRFKEGMHNAHNRWFYLRGLFVHNAAVPPMLLAFGLTWGFISWVFFRKTSLLFLLIWAVFPVLGYGALSSRMPWYIVPAFPAMSLLIGGFVTWVWDGLKKGLEGQGHYSASIRWLRNVTGALVVLISVLLLLHNIGSILLQIVSPKQFDFVRQLNYHEPINHNFRRGLVQWLEGETDYRLAADRVSRAIRATPQGAVIGYKLTPFAQHESIYIDMLRSRLIRVDDLDDVTERLAESRATTEQNQSTNAQTATEPVGFIMAPLAELATLLPLRTPLSYSILSPENRHSPFSWHRRFDPVIVLAFLPGLPDNVFKPIVQSWVPELSTVKSSSRQRNTVLSGFTDSFSIPSGGRATGVAIGVSGPRAISAFEGDRAMRALGGTLSINVGRYPRAKREVLAVGFYCNELKLGEVLLDGDAQVAKTFELPRSFISLGRNTITVTVQRQDGSAVGVREALVSLSDWTFALKTHPAGP